MELQPIRIEKDPSLYRRFLTTKEAARATGLSAYELRNGFKMGKYPALEIGGTDTRVRRLRWNLSALEEAIQYQMNKARGGEFGN